jgi:hypothetical protein
MIGGKMLRVRQTIKPGKRGTRRLLEKYGNRLVCVRYHYNYEIKKRITTVELIEEESNWRPVRILASTIVQIQINWGEKEIAWTIKKNGGKWNKEKQVWEISYGKVRELQLESRIVRK